MFRRYFPCHRKATKQEKTGKKNVSHYLFVLSMQKHLTPDEDLARAISMDDLLSGVKEDIREMYRTAKQ